MPISVALVEDNSSVRASLERVLAAAPEFGCVASCANAGEALRMIPAQRPDVVLMDIELPGLSGIECSTQLKQRVPELQILILTVYNDNEQIFSALEAGASGYLLKQSSPEEILQAIRDVREGGAPMSAEIARRVVLSFRRPEPSATESPLTPREAEIIELLARGYTSKEIADQLNVSYDTVCGHLGRIYAKLHVRSRTAAVVKYFRVSGGPAG